MYRRRVPGSWEIAETGVTARFLMIVKDFIPELGARSSAIMKGCREGEVSGGSRG
jgi:hypothetical protein